MRFAARCDFGDGTTAYGKALERARSAGTLIDLTVSNPTRCGFEYPEERLLAAMNDTPVLQYDADSLGLRSAREAVSALYRTVYGADVPPERLLLTASTSEAYGYLLRLFCEPGDAILVPSPSYPLFDLLARLHDVDVITYPLVYHDGWQIDPASLAAAVTSQTRAMIAIHPNNPTGHYCSPADRETLFAVARRHELPLIVDEVFLDYAIEAGRRFSFAARQERDVRKGHAEDGKASHLERPLTFVLAGLSKTLALPQMKLAWMAACGPADEVSEAMARLGVLADTFLSVAAPPQVALPVWLREREGLQKQILLRVRENLRLLDGLLAGSAVSRLRVEGGWSVVLRIPGSESDMDVALHLLRQHGVVMHPGSFYGFPEKGWLVISLLTPATMFEAGVRRLTRIEFGTPFPHADAPA